MARLVAVCAEGDEVPLCIVAQMAAWFDMVNLETSGATAYLATPLVSRQNFTAKSAISFRLKPQPGPLRTHASQTATCTVSNNCFLCGAESPRIIRVKAASNVPSLPVIKLTPARKSAQIISRQ